MIQLVLYELDAILINSNGNCNKNELVTNISNHQTNISTEICHNYCPIIRIYGRELTTSKSICVRVHHYFPYFYIKSNHLNVNMSIENYVEHLRCLLNDKMRIIENVELINIEYVTKKCIYGYRKYDEYYLKIIYSNPFMLENIDKAIRNDLNITPDGILYESHIPYLVNFLSDHNIYGMGKVMIDADLCINTPYDQLGNQETTLSTIQKSNNFILDIDIEINQIVINNQNKCNTVSQSMEWNPTIRDIWINEKNKRYTKKNWTSSMCSDNENIFDILETSYRDNTSENFFTSETVYNEEFLKDYIDKIEFNSTNSELCATQYDSLYISSGLCEMLQKTPNDYQYSNDSLDNHFLSNSHNTDSENEFSITSQQLYDSLLDSSIKYSKNILDTDRLDKLPEKISKESDCLENKITEELPIEQPLEYKNSEKIYMLDIENKGNAKCIPLFKSQNLLPNFSMKPEIGASTLIGSFDEWPPNALNYLTTRNDELIKESNNNNSQLCYTLKVDDFDSQEDNNYLQPLENLSSSLPMPSVVCMELYAINEKDYQNIPDPISDSIQFILFGYRSNFTDSETKYFIYIHKPTVYHMQIQNQLLSYDSHMCVKLFDNEIDMIDSFIDDVQLYDPDILLAYDVWMKSFGYLIDRCRSLGKHDIKLRLSRFPVDFQNKSIYLITSNKNLLSLTNDYHFKTYYGRKIHFNGRMFMCLWKMISHKYGVLHSYCLEYIVDYILKFQLPIYNRQTLQKWWNVNDDYHIYTVVRLCNYFKLQVNIIFALFDKINVVNEAIESSKLTGLPLMATMTRGSQIKVQSLICHVAKCENIILPSPSRSQVKKMNAPIYLPFIIEPETMFYKDSVIVLDFQSLYPSIIIAYNLCYSTCIGSIQNLYQATNDPNNSFYNFKIGYMDNYSIDMKHLIELYTTKQLFISPNGIIFVKPITRSGILPRILNTILKTRKLVKLAIRNKSNTKNNTNILDCRQLALKLILNLTYGLTAANYSGYLPCVEIADTIVCIARQLINKVINQIVTLESIKQYHPQVIYGDTDSVFVLIKSCSLKDTFQHVKTIVDDINSLFLQPIAIKFEKVYRPCFLQSKKRYVGYSYENYDQHSPIFDAKGIETVRHDFCAASSKILKRMLRLLFEKNDFSLLKIHFQQQCTRILDGRTSYKDFMISREFKGFDVYKYSSISKLPILKVIRNQLKYDPLSLPQKYWRMCYLFVNGHPNIPLYKLAKSMDEVLNNYYRLNSQYYILKQIIPPLNRFFCIFQINLYEWYASLPRYNKIQLNNHLFNNNHLPSSSHSLSKDHMVNTIWSYFSVNNACTLCGKSTRNGCSCLVDDSNIKSNCLNTFIFNYRINNLEKKLHDIESICNGCSEIYNIECKPIPCCNSHCSCFHKKVTYKNQRLTLLKMKKL